MSKIKSYDLYGGDQIRTMDVYKAGVVHDNTNGMLTGYFYKSPAFYKNLFQENDGFMFLHTKPGARPVGFKGYVYSKSIDGTMVMLGTYKSAKKSAYFSFVRREWLAKLLVETDEPIVRFFVNMWGRI